LRAYNLRGQVAEARLLELALLWERFDIARFAKEGYSKHVDMEKAFSKMFGLAETWLIENGLSGILRRMSNLEKGLLHRINLNICC
jgi:hypothetical protein